MFADELIALHEVCPDADITYIANLEERGLPKVRRDAARITTCIQGSWMSLLRLVGALDEYGAIGEQLGEKIKEINPDFAFIVGVPHAIPPEFTQGDPVLFGYQRAETGGTPKGSRAPVRRRGDRPSPEDSRCPPCHRK